MWPYILLFVASLATDLIPVIGPPVWTVMVFMVIKFDLNPWMALAVGVPASVAGRYGLSRYIGRFAGKVMKQRKSEELKFVGEKLNRSRWRVWFFVLLYSLLPLSTTALFSAVGMARIRPILILPPFFIGKFASDAIMVFSSRYALDQADLGSGLFTGKGIATMVGGLVVLAAFLFLDWRLLLEHRKFRLNFRIWK